MVISTLVLLLILSNSLISLASGDDPDVTGGQITTITRFTTTGCHFNRFCTCVTENIQSLNLPNIGQSPDSLYSDAAASEVNVNTTDDLLNSLNLDQQSNAIYSHSKLYEVTCLNLPFYNVPKLPSGHLYRLNLINAKQLAHIKSSSFAQIQISSITITRSKVQVIDSDSFIGSESTLTALDLSGNELSEFPSAALAKLSVLQWLSLKGNRIEEIKDLFSHNYKDSNKESRYRVRRSFNKHNLLNKLNDYKSKARHRRVRRHDEYRIPENVDWVVTKKESDLKPPERDQILLKRTSRKRHHSHAKRNQNKARNQMFTSFDKSSKKIDEISKINSNQNDTSNQKEKRIDDGYQNDDSYQVLKEDNQEFDQNNINQTDKNDTIENGILSLRSLLLSDNFLTSITGQTFTSLTNLEALDLNNNLIYKIEGRPFPPSLGSLSLANNLLEKFPVHSLRPLKQLRWLLLRGNMLKNSLPEEWPLTTNQIEILDLSRNLISSLNGFFFHTNPQKQSTRSKITLYSKNESNKQTQNTIAQQLITIKDLLLDNNLLRSLPDETFSNCKIERLILSNNRLSSISSNLFLNSPLSNSLRILDLSNNLLDQLDHSLVGLKKLQSLFVRNNQLRKLDESTFKSSVETLQVLDLSGNQFTQIPYQSFEPIKKLFKLNMQNNQIISLTKSDFQQWSKSLLSIILNKNQIESIEKDTFKYCSNLRELRLSSNKLYNVNSESFIPLGRKLSILELSDIGNSESDTIRKMEMNSSSSIKDGISKLKNIEFLELNYNSFDKLSGSSLSHLSNLVHLDLEGNNLNEIDSSLFDATKHSKLRNIILTDNKIRTLKSSTFSNLRQIINIAVINNQLETIESNAFIDLPQLSTILLSRNQLKSIKNSAFTSIKNLKNLFLQHNQLDELSLDMFNNTDLLVRNKMMLNDEQPRNNPFSNNQSPLKLNLQNSQLNQLGQLNQFNQFNQQFTTGLHLNASYNQIKQLITLSKLKLNSQTKDQQDNLTSSNLQNEIESEEEYQLNLSVLDLSFNQLTKLNGQFFQIIGKNLIKLIVNNNQLESFPLDSLLNCPNLQLISFKNNKINDLVQLDKSSLASLSLNTIDFSNLQLLDLSNNQIQNLTTYKTILSTTSKLVYLDLSFNKINNLVDNLFNGTMIQHLDLSNNQLFDIPFTLNCYGLKDSLISLILDSNQLSSLPKELNTCTNLNYLSIRFNQLTEIGHTAFFKLEHLLHLDLSGNTFYSIQNDAFDKLVNLRKLFLSTCNLESLPSLNDCNELVQLDLSNNSLTYAVLQQTQNAISNFNSILKCRKLRTLNLSMNQLNEVPRTLWKYLNSITELDLSSNPIELLDSSSLSDLKNLRIIDIRNLQLKYVDSRVFHNHKYEMVSFNSLFFINFNFLSLKYKTSHLYKNINLSEC